ncbi:small metal-binding protein SmbP [Methylococcus sp. EFPC2]|uniref:small metal-binding protein SmbP n=1 Tax=Methylococcus sp. EFPC2 TaxID=2812648 RepID=UPI001967ADE2|nr:small metal-binding protein SmbP [Methylococcus sp. EFPC2]QSA98760.1 hypothetical protein JWZ97_08255 [Methylococcus sp. EFPC2]
MKPYHVFTALLVSSFFSASVAQAAGAPMSIDFSQIKAHSEKAVADGKQGNAAAFEQGAEEALKQAKEQNDKRSSPAMQRIVGKLRTAVNEAKAGKIAEGTQAVEEAIAEMKQPAAPKFGGGS